MIKSKFGDQYVNSLRWTKDILTFCRFEFTSTAVNQGYNLEFTRWIRVYLISTVVACRATFPNNCRNDVFQATPVLVPGALTIDPEDNSVAVPAGQTVTFNPVPVVCNYMIIRATSAASNFITIGYQ